MLTAAEVVAAAVLRYKYLCEGACFGELLQPRHQVAMHTLYSCFFVMMRSSGHPVFSTCMQSPWTLLRHSSTAPRAPSAGRFVDRLPFCNAAAQAAR